MKKIIFLFLILLAVGITLWWWHGTSAVNSQDGTKQNFVVAQGEGSKQIASELQNAHLVPDQTVFLLLLKMSGFEGKLQAGNFQVSPNQTPQQIITTLTNGTNDAWITIPEGLRATEIAAILKSKLSSYNPSWDAMLTANEGYLFPDTYSFPKDATIDQIIQTMRDNFDKKYALAKKIQTNTLTQQQVITLASIVQREAVTPHDMQYVASVFENRLNIGMALGSDVTVEYALGYDAIEKTWWKKNLTADDLAVNSPYNTRTNAGLPPGPISNPGLVAIEAVMNPPQSDYMYFIADSKGVVHFAKTLEGHNANIAKYGE